MKELAAVRVKVRNLALVSSCGQEVVESKGEGDNERDGLVEEGVSEHDGLTERGRGKGREEVRENSTAYMDSSNAQPSLPVPTEMHMDIHTNSLLAETAEIILSSLTPLVKYVKTHITSAVRVDGAGQTQEQLITGVGGIV